MPPSLYSLSHQADGPLVPLAAPGLLGVHAQPPCKPLLLSLRGRPRHLLLPPVLEILGHAALTQPHLQQRYFRDVLKGCWSKKSSFNFLLAVDSFYLYTKCNLSRRAVFPRDGLIASLVKLDLYTRMDKY